MDRLPTELRMKILSYLTTNFETLENLKKVFPHDPLIEYASHSIQAITFKSKTRFGHQELLYGSLPLKLPPQKIHEVNDILFKETHFQYPVECLFLSNIRRYLDPKYEEKMENIGKLFSRETNLLKVKALMLSDFDTRFRDYHWDALNLLFKDFKKSDGVTSHYRTRFPNIEELTLERTYCSKIPLLPTLKKLTIISHDSKYGNQFFFDQNVGTYRSIRQDLKTKITLNSSKFKFPKLEHLILKEGSVNIEDEFDRNMPRLKFLKLSRIKLKRVPKFAMTSLQELHLWLADGLDLQNLSTLVNLKKLVIIGNNPQINGIAQLAYLKHLELKRMYSADIKTIDLDGKLPKNIKELKLKGFKNKEIKDMPQKLKILALHGTGNAKIVNLNSELSVLDIRHSSISEIDCDVSYLTKILARSVKNLRCETFIFNDKSSFQQQYKAFNDYCLLKGIIYKHCDEFKQHN